MKKCVVTYDNKLVESIKYVKIVNNVESCTVGYLPAYLVARAAAEGCHNCFVTVVKLYSNSPNIIERRKDHQNRGMALCAIITTEFAEIQSLE
jgi:hypothetical protein